jgi:hypothetical protein
MSDELKIVLPDTLVAQQIDNAATLSAHLQQDFNLIISKRENIRSELISQRKIIRISPDSQPLTHVFAVDGAHLAEIDRASAYSASCAVSVGQEVQPNEQSSCLAILPHVPSLNTLSSTLMMMQEIMMTVKAIESDADSICLIDGSRISTIININSFYAGVQRDMPDQLSIWRQQSSQQPDREPGRTLRLFESKDWLSTYLTNPNIVGNVKLVTTTNLISKYAPAWVGRFDDKTLAALVLEGGEALDDIELPHPEEPYHIHHNYPFYHGVNDKNGIGDQLVNKDNPSQLFHIYYRPHASHGVFKIELNATLLNKPEILSKLFAWWRNELDTPDLEEPYSLYIADKFAKEAVSVAKNALKEITRRDMMSASLTWFFTQSYRTE